jgi:tetratricopeptide (TPR) repeat protein
MLRRVAFAAVIALAIAPDVRAQEEPAVPEEEGDEGGGDTGPGDLAAAATSRVVVDQGIPDAPAKPPDRFAVMAFENHTNVRALDWVTTGPPLALAEKIEQHVGLIPAYDAWVIPPGPVIDGTPENVARFGAAKDARWVWTGWVERPNWLMRLVITLWRIDVGPTGPVATKIGDVDQTGQFSDVHVMSGLAAARLLDKAGYTLGDTQRAGLQTNASKDLYAFTLAARGVAHVRGTLGVINPKLAEHDLERAVFIEPTMAVAQRLVGQLYLEYPFATMTREPTDPRERTRAINRAAARAAGKFAYAVDLSPQYVAAVRASAEAARAAQKHDIARELLERVVRLRAWDLDARVELAEAMWKIGDGGGAIRELERVLRRRPDDLGARRMIALVHSDRGDVLALVGALEEIARRAPDDMDVRMDLGAAYGALGRWDDARAAYLVVAAARPSDPTVMKLLGDVERRRADYTAAAAWYGRMEKAAPDDPRPPFLIGLAWLDGGQVEKAHKAFIRAQKFREFVGEAFAALGAVQYRAHRYDEALWYLRRAAQRRPHRGESRLALARVLIRKQQGAAAVSQAQAARTLGIEGPEPRYLEALGRAVDGDLDGARVAIKQAVDAAEGGDAQALATVRAAQAALDRGVVPDLEGDVPVDVPFGDGDAFERAIDRFQAAEKQLAEVRKALDTQYLTALAALGEGPGKDLSKAARNRPWKRVCPIVAVGKPWVAARRLERELLRRGLVLEQAWRAVDVLDGLGESAALTPDYRRRVGEVRRGWRRALVGVREVRSELQNQLGRELRARRCKDELLVAAAARPELYGRVVDKTAAAPPAPEPPRRAVTATLYVDNRECNDPIELWIDGEKIGAAPPGQRSAFEASVGQRTICLLVPGEAGQCGDRGTVREAYLHDGWSTVVHCRAAAR